MFALLTIWNFIEKINPTSKKRLALLLLIFLWTSHKCTDISVLNEKIKHFMCRNIQFIKRIHVWIRKIYSTFFARSKIFCLPQKFKTRNAYVNAGSVVISHLSSSPCSKSLQLLTKPAGLDSPCQIENNTTREVYQPYIVLGAGLRGVIHSSNKSSIAICPVSARDLVLLD